MYSLQEILGISSVILFVVAYIPYFWSIRQGQTKPHPYSWTAWGILLVITFFIQLSEGAGPGAWGTGVVAGLQLSVALIGWIQRGAIAITKSDRVSFAAALISIFLWLIADSPLLAIVLITTVDVFGYWPTFRKTFREPYSENLLAYGISTCALMFSIFALETFNAITATEPLAFLIMNVFFVTVIAARRRFLSQIRF